MLHITIFPIHNILDKSTKSVIIEPETTTALFVKTIDATNCDVQ